MRKKVKLARIDEIKAFAKEKPLQFGGIVMAAVVVSYVVLSALGLFGETERTRWSFGANQNVAIETGDSLVWIGMKVVPINSTLRKEFKIPGKIKGMFVLDEGTGLARNYQLKTGDVIVSVCRKPVADARAFVKAANDAQHYEGILLDVYRNGDSRYMTIPFSYQYGPLMGPFKGSWQLGSPLIGKAMPYGKLMADNTNTQNQ